MAAPNVQGPMTKAKGRSKTQFAHVTWDLGFGNYLGLGHWTLVISNLLPSVSVAYRRIILEGGDWGWMGQAWVASLIFPTFPKDNL